MSPIGHVEGLAAIANVLMHRSNGPYSPSPSHCLATAQALRGLSGFKLRTAKCPALLGLLALRGRILLKTISTALAWAYPGSVGRLISDRRPLSSQLSAASNRLRRSHAQIDSLVLLSSLTLPCDCAGTVYILLDLAFALPSVA